MSPHWTIQNPLQRPPSSPFWQESSSTHFVTTSHWSKIAFDRIVRPVREKLPLEPPLARRATGVEGLAVDEKPWNVARSNFMAVIFMACGRGLRAPYRKTHHSGINNRRWRNSFCCGIPGPALINFGAPRFYWLISFDARLLRHGGGGEAAYARCASSEGS